MGEAASLLRDRHFVKGLSHCRRMIIKCFGLSIRMSIYNCRPETGTSSVSRPRL
jgi:hypothetical protein